MKLSQKPKIEIIAIGSELLSPFQEDTNSGYIAQRLNDLGMEVSFNTIVGDDRINLLQAAAVPRIRVLIRYFVRMQDLGEISVRPVTPALFQYPDINLYKS